MHRIDYSTRMPAYLSTFELSTLPMAAPYETNQLALPSPLSRKRTSFWFLPTHLKPSIDPFNSLGYPPYRSPSERNMRCCPRTQRETHTDCKRGTNGWFCLLWATNCYLFIYARISKDKVIIGCNGVGNKGDMTKRWDDIPGYTSPSCQYNEVFFFILPVGCFKGVATPIKNTTKGEQLVMTSNNRTWSPLPLFQE